MMWWIAALIAAQAGTEPSETRVQATRQAQATVRIVSAAIIALDSGEIVRGDAPAALRDTRLNLADGTREPAKLVEFQ